MRIFPFALLLLTAGCATIPAGGNKLRPLFATSDIVVNEATDVVVTTGDGVTVRMPAGTTGVGRIITVRAREGATSIAATAPDTIEGEAAFGLDAGEMVTLMSDGRGNWVVISSSDL